jgi:hypothetical protein
MRKTDMECLHICFFPSCDLPILSMDFPATVRAKVVAAFSHQPCTSSTEYVHSLSYAVANKISEGVERNVVQVNNIIIFLN